MRLILCFALLCGSAFGQIAVDHSGTNSGSTAVKTGSCTIASISANALVLFTELVDDDGTTTFNTPTATGLTFAQVGTTVHSAGNYYFLEWRAYTASSLGSTAITGTWNTTNADWNDHCASFTGTAGTAGNNGSDAIGNTSLVDSGTTASPTTTVTSSSHDNSKYFGAIGYAFASGGVSITPGASYTAITASVFNANFLSLRTELSTNPVSPATNTAVNASGTSHPSGLLAVELLVSGGAPPATCTPTMALMGVGSCG
jgi:hypothetical protein